MGDFRFFKGPFVFDTAPVMPKKNGHMFFSLFSRFGLNILITINDTPTKLFRKRNSNGLTRISFRQKMFVVIHTPGTT